MKSQICDPSASVQQLRDRGFEMPIHFVAVETNGSVIGGTYSLTSNGRDFACEITIPSANPNGLTAPVNIMYVDQRNTPLADSRSSNTSCRSGRHASLPEGHD
jgi:hypothetical protein